MRRETNLSMILPSVRLLRGSLSVFVEDNGVLPPFPLRTTDRLNWVDFSCGAVSRAFSKLNDKLSFTPEGIPAYFLKRASLGLVYPCSLLFKYSFRLSLVPSP